MDKCKKLAEIFEVSLDDLANYKSEDSMGMPFPPKGKHLFGMVTVGDKGQIVIPAKARKIFEISPGDQLVVLGDERQGLAIMKSESIVSMWSLLENIVPTILENGYLSKSHNGQNPTAFYIKV